MPGPAPKINCDVCGQERSLLKSGKKADGSVLYARHCLPCRRKYTQTYQRPPTKLSPEVSRERNTEYCRRWRRKHPERAKLASIKTEMARDHVARKAYKRQWFAERPEYHRQSHAKQEARSPGYSSRIGRLWRARNQGSLAAYRLANVAKIAAYFKEWATKNPDKRSVYKHARRARENAANGSHTAAEWRTILARHKSKCVTCGAKGKMTKDHIIPLSRGGTNFVYNLQPMCLGCNIRKATSIAAGTQHSLFDRIAV